MSFATNGIVNASGGDPSTGGNSFSDPDAQYGGVAVGSADSFLGVSANSSVVGNSNVMNASVNAGVLGRGNTLYDSNYSWIVGGDGKTYNSTPNTTFIPNRYVSIDSGNVKTSTGSAAAAPRYLQLPGVVAAPSGANDEFTFAVPAGAASFDSAGESVYVKKAAGWTKVSDESNAATLNNKSLVDASTFIVDDVDNTKKMQFQCAGITTATTRTLTVPNASGTIVLDTNTQTLTNKSLADATTFVIDNVDPTKKMQFECAGITTATTRTLTVPDASGTIVIGVAGTTNQITASTTNGTATLSLPSAITTPGSLTTTTGLAAGSSVRVGSYYIDTYRGIIASGTTQLTANYGVLGSWIVCTSVLTGTNEGIALPAASPGYRITILNKSGNAITPLKIYPTGLSNYIDNAGSAGPVLLPNNACIVLEAVNTSQWYTIQPYLSAGAGTSITYGDGTVSVAGITNTLAATLTAGNSTGASDIVVSASQQIKYNAGIRIGSDGANAGSAGFGGISIGNAAAGSGYRASAIGYAAVATHTDAVAIGVSTTTDNDKQIKLGANNTFYVETPGYILSGLQKSCAAGITPGVSTGQAITSGSGITTVLIKDTLYDFTPAMVSGNTVQLTDPAHVHLVSILVRGTFGAGLAGRTYTLYLYWNDGTNTLIIGQQDIYVAASAGVFSCTISTGMKTIVGSTGQYIYAGLDNTSGATMTVDHYRITATRIA